jgi:hypothetical protein
VGNLRRSPMAVGPRCPTYGTRPFDGTTGGRGNTRDVTGARWLGSGGRLRSFRDIMRAADARENKMAPVSNKFCDPNPSGAKMLARVLVVIGASRLG